MSNTSTRMLFGHLDHITSTRMLFGHLDHITSTRMLFGHLDHITSTRMLFGHLDHITSTRVLFDDFEHIILTRMLLGGTTQSKQISLIFSEVLRTIFLVDWKLVVFLRILGKRIKTAIISLKILGKWGKRGILFPLSLSGDWTHWIFFSLYH